MRIPFISNESEESFLRRLKTPAAILPFMQELLGANEDTWLRGLGEMKSTKELLALSPEMQAAVVVDSTHLLTNVVLDLNKKIGMSGNAPKRANYSLQWLVKELMETRLFFTEAQVCEMLELLTKLTGLWWDMPLKPFIGYAEGHITSNGLSDSMRQALAAAYEGPAQKPTADMRKLRARITSILHRNTDAGAPPLSLKPHEPWAQAAAATLNSLPQDAKVYWLRLFDVAQRAPGSAPSAKWLKQAGELLAAIGPDLFKQNLCEWMKLASKGVIARNPFTGEGECEVGLDTENADVLRGLVWAAASLDDPSLAVSIGDFAEACYKKLQYVGPRSAKVGNACVAALVAMTGDEPAAQLSRLKQKVKQPTGRKMAEKGITKFADRAGLTPQEMEERVVPTYGLSLDGSRHDKLGDFTAVAKIAGMALEINWQGADGKPRQSIPAAVKKDHSAELKQLQAVFKQINSALPAQRDRLERSLLQDRSWPLELWRQFYADHPLVGPIARRLIWTVGDIPVLPQADHLTDVSGKTVKADSKDTVRLWHPIGLAPNDVLAWRLRLEVLEIIQPFKQAHREVYILTDAERNTDTYSNRFAAHVLRQHQFAALAQQRGWTYRLMGNFDSHNIPSISLPNWNMRVEFWVESAPSTPLSESGICVYISTDQARFYRIDPPQQLSLQDVPPLFFSELMRDIDLFVGVASVGNDPTWQDGGPDGRFRTYWQHVSFGELSETAKTRHAVLESLMPRLTKLKDRWELTERFLVIRGQLRTYKIHLGSGNILMEPNDQYLCIVPGSVARSKQSDSIFLPFEGDSTLSVILSKAFLLAADKSITDTTITRQLTLR